MFLFDKLKTGNPMLDTIITTFVLSIFTFIFQRLNDYSDDIIRLFKKINILIFFHYIGARLELREFAN